jgi:hypothetical protein
VSRAFRLAITVIALASPAAAQTPLSDSVAKLNRTGRWADAAQLAEDGIRGTVTDDERCALHLGAIYSLTRLGAYAGAAAELRTFENQCAASPAPHQQGVDLESIRSELTLPRLPTTGLDFSAIDQFWKIADLLAKDVEPSDEQWRALMSSVGYRLSMMEVPTTRPDMEIALRPSHRAEFDLLTKGGDDQAARLKHLVAAVGHRAKLARYRDSLTRTLPVKEAVAMAARFLPPHATEGKDPPLVAFALFRDDAYSLGPLGVIVDLENVSEEGGLTSLLAHEFHHSYLSALRKVLRPTADQPAAFLVNALSNMRNEGIADLIDKPYPLSYPNSPGLSRYAQRYNEAYARTPAVLRSIDSALVVAADDSMQLRAVGRRVQMLLPSSGHFNGSYVAREIYETFGVDSLFPGVSNPFAFLRTYAAAEAKRGDPPPFSAKAVALLDALERKYKAP